MQPLKHTLLLLLIILFSASYAQKIHERPVNDSLVNDFAGVLTKSQKNTLEYKLRYFHDTTSNQIVVVTLNSLDGYDPASYAFALGEQWGIGQKDFNNGIVILVKPKYSSSDKGQIFIATGYGLEPVIPDATGKRIVEKEMVRSGCGCINETCFGRNISQRVQQSCRNTLVCRNFTFSYYPHHFLFYQPKAKKFVWNW